MHGSKAAPGVLSFTALASIARAPTDEQIRSFPEGLDAGDVAFRSGIYERDQVLVDALRSET